VKYRPKHLLLMKQVLRSVVNYDKRTGVFTWKKPVGGRCAGAGRIAGGADVLGYWVITYRGVRLKGHRLAWLSENGRLPEMIDHINGERSDNRISNLRESNVVHNGRNRREHRQGKLLGTSFRKDTGRWVAQCWRDNKKIYLGQFNSEQMAHRAFTEFERHETRKPT